MDPITACANVITAILNYATEVQRGMTDAQRKELNDWVLADMRFWRHVFHLPDSIPGPKA